MFILNTHITNVLFVFYFLKHVESLLTTNTQKSQIKLTRHRIVIKTNNNNNFYNHIIIPKKTEIRILNYTHNLIYLLLHGKLRLRGICILFVLLLKIFKRRWVFYNYSLYWWRWLSYSAYPVWDENR